MVAKKPKLERIQWETKLHGIKNTIQQSRTTRPNPLVAGEFVFASICSPGAVCAAKRETGEILWMRPLDSFGADSVFLHGRNFYATSTRTLYALDPNTGRVRWQFSPASDPGEWIYSSPSAGAGRVFLGDRCGYFHCLDAKTGSKLWRRLSSKGDNNQVNSTALVTRERVVSANNEGAVVCYSSETGRTLWRQKVVGACTRELLRFRSNVIVAANSLYAIDLKTGMIRNQWSFPLKTVKSVAVVGSRIALILGTGFQAQPSAWYEASAFDGDLVILEGGRETSRLKLNGTPSLLASTEDGWLYTVTHSEVNVFDASNASPLRTRQGEFAQAAISGHHLYGLTVDGVLFCEPVL
ncbi:MAG TPA: PQQ-binding-like beta-propeller repeat protein [Acidobacteriaceae bacterium]|jgi:outer membrane protein assembly factor BamB